MVYRGSRRELALLSGSHDENYRDMTVGPERDRQLEKGSICLDAVGVSGRDAECVAPVESPLLLAGYGV